MHFKILALLGSQCEGHDRWCWRHHSEGCDERKLGVIVERANSAFTRQLIKCTTKTCLRQYIDFKTKYSHGVYKYEFRTWGYRFLNNHSKKTSKQVTPHKNPLRTGNTAVLQSVRWNCLIHCGVVRQQVCVSGHLIERGIWIGEKLFRRSKLIDISTIQNENPKNKEKFFWIASKSHNI